MIDAYRMDPEPCAVATILGASWELGDLKLGVEIPHASVVDGEDSEIFWLEGMNVRLIRNSERTTLHVVEPGGMNSGRLGARAGEVVAISNVTSVNGATKIAVRVDIHG